MKHQAALALANDMLRAFIESQDIPPGGTTGTAASHGEKTAEFLAALHRTLYEHFLKIEENS
jgi:hypothetical protein